MKIVFVDNKAKYAFDTNIQRAICEKYGYEYVLLDCADEDEIIEKAHDADAILDVYMKITPRIIDSLTNCKCLVRFGIGYDVIDLEAATKKGIFVCNIPDYCIEEVATHTVALLLAIVRKIPFYNDLIRGQGVWQASAGYKPNRLSTQTVGLFGFGNIARLVARYMSAFGCRILAYDPYLPEEVFQAHHVERVELDELLANSDILSLHTPLFDSTYHTIRKDTIAKMKDGALLVNTSRGPLVCEKDLLEAIDSGKLTAAGLDVAESEPITEAGHPLFASGRIVVTPHAAFSSVSASRELLEKVALTACQILDRDFNDELVRRIVNRNELKDIITAKK